MNKRVFRAGIWMIIIGIVVYLVFSTIVSSLQVRIEYYETGSGRWARAFDPDQQRIYEETKVWKDIYDKISLLGVACGIAGGIAIITSFFVKIEEYPHISQPPTEGKRYCRYCGKEIPIDANLCPYCGYDFR